MGDRALWSPCTSDAFKRRVGTALSKLAAKDSAVTAIWQFPNNLTSAQAGHGDGSARPPESQRWRALEGRRVSSAVSGAF